MLAEHHTIKDRTFGTRHVVREFFMYERQSKNPELEALFSVIRDELIPHFMETTPVPIEKVNRIEEAIAQHLKDYRTQLLKRMKKVRPGKKKQVREFAERFNWECHDAYRLAAALRGYQLYSTANKILLPLRPCIHKVMDHSSKLNTTDIDKFFHFNLMDLNSHIAENYYQLKMYQRARIYLDEVVDLGNKIQQELRKLSGIAETIAFALSRISLIECTQSFYKLAKRSLIFALKHVSVENSRSLLNSMVVLSQGLASQAEYQAAASWLQRAVDTYPRLVVRTDRAHTELDEFQRNLKDHEKSIITYKTKHLQACRDFCETQHCELDIKNRQVSLEVELDHQHMQMLNKKLGRKLKHCEFNANQMLIKHIDRIPLNTLKTIISTTRSVVNKYQKHLREKANHLAQQEKSVSQPTVIPEDVPEQETRHQQKPVRKPIDKEEQETTPVLKVKTKTRGNVPAALKAKAPPQTPAQKLGFKDERFGNHTLFRCRQRGNWEPPFYVALIEPESKKVIPEAVKQKFRTVIENAKIVPALGEQGLKWKFFDEKDPELKVKILGEHGSWRMLPIVRDQNEDGETGFGYGIAYQK